MGSGSWAGWTGAAALCLAAMAPSLAQAAAPEVAPSTSLAPENHREGPRSLLITYRVDPAKRAAFRDLMAHEQMARLAAWRKQGIVASYQILFKPYADDYTWDAMLVLRFARFTDVDRWLAIENEAPGGLSPAGLALATPANSYFADLDWTGGVEGADKDALFYVIPYEYRAEAEYRRYMDGYVLPQVQGWMREGVLSGYRIFINRYPVGKPWDCLFVLRYRDLDAFGKREATIAKVRDALQSDPQWKAWSDNKAGIRTESENAIAVALPEVPAR